MKFEKTEVWGFEHAIRGMRNSFESWDRSDSSIKFYCDQRAEWVDKQCTYDACCNSCLWEKKFFIGRNDLELARKLIKAGSEHRKFMRQIFVSVDITAPAYFMAELDTYKIGTTRNSTSMQHKGTSHRYTIDDFEVDEKIKEVLREKTYETSKEHELFEHCWYWECLLENLNILRDKYLETKDYKYFRLIRQLMPMSYLYTSTVTLSYENILNMYNQRCVHLHKLTEWSKTFKEWVEMLPYAKELICIPLEKK